MFKFNWRRRDVWLQCAYFGNDVNMTQGLSSPPSLFFWEKKKKTKTKRDSSLLLTPLCSALLCWNWNIVCVCVCVCVSVQTVVVVVTWFFFLFFVQRRRGGDGNGVWHTTRDAISLDDPPKEAEEDAILSFHTQTDAQEEEEKEKEKNSFQSCRPFLFFCSRPSVRSFARSRTSTRPSWGLCVCVWVKREMKLSLFLE